MLAKILNNKKQANSAPMNDKTFFISKPAFNELCKYVCFQIQPSGSEQIDREALNFAIYWQICCLLDEQVEFITGLASKTRFYQRLLQDTIDSQPIEPFDVSEIIDSNISEVFKIQYPKSNKFANQRRDGGSEDWVENFSFC